MEGLVAKHRYSDGRDLAAGRNCASPALDLGSNLQLGLRGGMGAFLWVCIKGEVPKRHSTEGELPLLDPLDLDMDIEDC